MLPNLMEPLLCKSKLGSKTYNLLANKNISGHQMSCILRYNEQQLRKYKGSSCPHSIVILQGGLLNYVF